MSLEIHKTSIIDSNAQIGKNVYIGPNCIVGPNVILGDDVWIQSGVRIDKDTIVGDKCKIYHGASVGNDPQDLKYNGESGILKIGSETTIREFATLHRGTKASGETVIGSNCLLMDYTHVPHDCRIGNHVVVSNSVQIGGHASIGDWTVIGGLTGIHQFVKIGSHCMIGFGYRVVKDVPHYVLAAGEPLKPVGLNKVGLKRRGFTDDVIDNVYKAYKILYHEKLLLKTAIKKIKDELPAIKEIEDFLDFIEKSERGILR